MSNMTIIASAYYVGLFDPDRMLEGIPSIFGLVIEGLPPRPFLSSAITREVLVGGVLTKDGLT